MIARLVNCSIKDYHADLFGEVPTFNASTAKAMVTESAMHAYYYHPRLGGNGREDTDAKNKGSIIHRLLLGAGAEVTIIHADSFRTNAAKEARDAAIAAGRIPIIASKYEFLQSAATQINIRLKECGIDLMAPGSVREQPVLWEVSPEVSGLPEPVLCRAMFDYLDLDSIIGLDIKSITCASDEKVKRQIVSMGYDVQDAHYSNFLETFAPDMMGKVSLGFAFLETDAPYGVRPVRASESLREYGRMRWLRALRMWYACLKSGKWQGYVDPKNPWQLVDAPNWALMAELEQQDDEEKPETEVAE